MYKVIVVEDESLIRKGLIYMVDWMRFDCVIAGEADNGAKGEELIHGLRPDLVISDIRMPLLGGIEMLTNTIRAYDYEAILLTGYSDFTYAKTAIGLGVSEYLLKPVELEAMNRAMEKAVDAIEKKYRLQRFEAEKAEELPRVLDLDAIEQNLTGSARHAKAMVDYIKDNYARKIAICDLSGQLRSSTTSLNKIFKGATTYTFHEFLNRYRIRQAVRLLLTTDKKIYEIAAETGFTDYKYFILVFKKYIGCAPLTFAAKTARNLGL